MEEDTNKFHLETIISVIMGKFLSPIAKKEYPDLCEFLFKNNNIGKWGG